MCGYQKHLPRCKTLIFSSNSARFFKASALWVDAFYKSKCPYVCVCVCHKCFKCWWLALPEKKTITKPLRNKTFNHGLPEGPSHPVLTIIIELLR